MNEQKKQNTQRSLFKVSCVFLYADFLRRYFLVISIYEHILKLINIF